MNQLVDKLDKQLLATVKLGLDAEAFIQSPLGEHLIDKAREEAIDAMNDLKTVEPTNSKYIQELQNKIHRAENFEAWLFEVVQSGRNAEEQLERESAPD